MHRWFVILSCALASAAAMRGGDTRMAVAVRATAEPQAPATVRSAPNLEAVGALLARVAMTVLAIPWIVGVIWLGWNL